jgi:hypothetical protein
MNVESRAAEQGESESATRHAPHEVRARRALFVDGPKRIDIGSALLRPRSDSTIKS